MNKVNEVIDTIKKYTQIESWQKELVLTSNYYYVRINCLYIERILLKEKVLYIELINSKHYEFLIDEETNIEIVDRTDLNIIEDKPRRRRSV